MLLWVLLSAFTISLGLAIEWPAEWEWDTDTVCAGDDYSFSGYAAIKFDNRQVLFIPKSSPNSTRIVMEPGKIIDPRFKRTSITKVRLLSVTKEYEGEFKMVYPLTNATQSVRFLKVKDCIQEKEGNYGDNFTLKLSSYVDQIDFSRDSRNQRTVILWSRSKGIEDRGKLEDEVFKMNRLTQADQGLYTLTDQGGLNLGKHRLSVKEVKIDLELMTRENLTIRFPMKGVDYTLAQHYHQDPPIYLVYKGQSAEHQQNSKRFKGRVELMPMGVVVKALKVEDSGIYRLTDSVGNTAVEVHLIVRPLYRKEDFDGVNFSGVSVMGIVVSVVVIVMCLLRNWCRKSCSDKPTTAVCQTESDSHPYATVVNQAPYDAHTPSANQYPGTSATTSYPTAGSTSLPYTPYRPYMAPSSEASYRPPAPPPYTPYSAPEAVSSYQPPPYSPYTAPSTVDSNIVVGGGGGDLAPSNTLEPPTDTGSLNIQASGGGGVDVPQALGGGGLDVPQASGGGGVDVPQASGGGGVDAPTINLGFDILSSDSGRQFDSTSTVPPLSSDTPSFNVYNSDKLNFL